MRSEFIGAKVVGSNVSSAVYLRQMEGVKRGNPQFVMSRSELMLFASNPSRWIAGYYHKDSDATYFGSLLDCLVTSPDKFSEIYAVRPKTVKATKTMTCVKEGEAEVGDPVPWRECTEAKDWKAKVAHEGKEAVPADDFEEANQALTRLMEDDKARDLLACSHKQVMVMGEYQDRLTGLIIPVKGLIDIVPALDSGHGDSLADFKTCRSAAPRDWIKAIDQRHYDAQAALFIDLYEAATGEGRATFLHLLQENTFPFQVGRRIVGGEFMAIGRHKYENALKLYCACLKANIWPSWDDLSALNGWTIADADEYMKSRDARDYISDDEAKALVGLVPDTLKNAMKPMFASDGDVIP
jgi:PDDEXK-like domain of unknown function (DUF3799)